LALVNVVSKVRAVKIENQTQLSRDLLRRRIQTLDFQSQDATRASAHPIVTPNINEYPARGQATRRAILALLAIFLIWEVITRSFSAYLADAAPETAILLRPTNATALLHLAQDAIRVDPVLNPRDKGSKPIKDTTNTAGATIGAGDSTDKIHSPSAAASSAPPPRTVAQIRAWVDQALQSDPLNARGFAILGHLAEKGSDPKKAKEFMGAATRRSLLETPAVYYMMQSTYENRDFTSAISYADALMRNRYASIASVMPILGQIAEDPTGAEALKKRLDVNPPWRKAFFARLPERVTDVRSPLQLLLSMKKSPSPPTPPELQPYLQFLINHKFYQLAYYTWLQFLPPEQLYSISYLYNADFEWPPTGLPFDWTFSEGPGFTIQIERPDPQAEHALVVKFTGGRIGEFGIKQLLMLAPGKYQFRGKYTGDVSSERGLLWRVTCYDSKATPLVESPPVNGSSSDWSALEVSFVVPDDCPAQSIELTLGARSISERFASGSISFADLNIAREPTAQKIN
jgi:hypothetical protein